MNSAISRVRLHLLGRHEFRSFLSLLGYQPKPTFSGDIVGP
jgi:hypothetical protein